MPSLGNDLASIREEKGLSVQDIHNATKIPPHILESIEDDSIFDDLDRNATYIRSYVRSYAKQLEIDDERIIRALNQVEEGTYSGLLRKDYEGPLPKFQSRHKEEDKKEGEEEESGDQGEESEGEEPEPDEDAKPETTETPKEKPTERPAADPQARRQPSRIAPPPAGTASETPTVDSVDWVDMGKRFKPLKSQSPLQIGIAVFAVILTVAAIFYYLNTEGGSISRQPEEQATTTEAIQPDSLQLSLANPDDSGETVSEGQNEPAEALSDTLSLTIYAAYEKLEPVRVYTDVMGSLNPYWIELGEAVRFHFVNTIRIRGPYERMELLLNGHIIENFQERFLNPESGLLEINREVFEGDPKWLQPPPDSLGLSVPDPSVITDQPVFN